MKTIFLTIILIISKQTPNVQTVRDNFAYAKQSFAAVDVNLRLAKIQKVREVKVPRLESSVNRYYDWLKWRDNNFIEGRAVVILPKPVAHDVIGIASLCQPQGTAVINYSFGSNAEVIQSEVAFTHEVGHLLGAEHDTGRDIMNGVILLGDYVGEKLPRFSNESINEIKSCVGNE